MFRATSRVAAPLAVLLLSACSQTSPATAPTGPSSSSAGPVAVTARMQPPVVPLVPVTGFGCPARAPFTTSFALVIQSQATVNMSVDRVTIHFLDGTNISSTPIGFSTRPSIPAGSLITLPFTPHFGCGIGVPRSIVADVTLLDPFGIGHTVTAQAATQ